MKICATSDLHGHLPKIPACDILCIAGDISPVWDHDISFQCIWFREKFLPWLDEQPIGACAWVAGNHDIWCEKLPEIADDWKALSLNNGKLVYYLMDRSVEIKGIKIYGSPWQRRFYDWSFNLDEPELSTKFEKIPKCDILITHSPPYCAGDFSPYGKENCGSVALRDMILKRKPKLHFFGHIHSGYGRYKIGKTISANVSLVNEKYTPVNNVMEFEI